MRKLLVRREEARKMLGVGDFVMRRMVNTKQLPPLYFTKGGKPYFRTIDVLRMGGITNESDLNKVDN